MYFQHRLGNSADEGNSEKYNKSDFRSSTSAQSTRQNIASNSDGFERTMISGYLLQGNDQKPKLRHTSYAGLLFGITCFLPIRNAILELSIMVPSTFNPNAPPQFQHPKCSELSFGTESFFYQSEITQLSRLADALENSKQTIWKNCCKRRMPETCFSKSRVLYQKAVLEILPIFVVEFRLPTFQQHFLFLIGNIRSWDDISGFSGSVSFLLFSATYLICKKNYSFSRVIFLFSDQNC